MSKIVALHFSIDELIIYIGMDSKNEVYATFASFNRSFFSL